MTQCCVVCGKPVQGYPEEDCGEICHGGGKIVWLTKEV